MQGDGLVGLIDYNKLKSEQEKIKSDKKSSGVSEELKTK